MQGILTYYIYFDAYGNFRKAVTSEELELRFGNDAERFRAAMDEQCSMTNGHVSIFRCERPEDLEDFLSTLNEELAAGFYGCASDSRPYNF